VTYLPPYLPPAAPLSGLDPGQLRRPLASPTTGPEPPPSPLSTPPHENNNFRLYPDESLAGRRASTSGPRRRWLPRPSASRPEPSLHIRSEHLSFYTRSTSYLSTSDPSTSHSTQDPQAPPPGVDDSDGRGRILDGHGRGERNRHRRLADRLQTRRQSPHGDTTSLLALSPLSLSLSLSLSSRFLSLNLSPSTCRSRLIRRVEPEPPLKLGRDGMVTAT
jgi:hypothetical protein